MKPFNWIKLGQVFDSTKVKVEDKPWLKSHAQCTSAIVFPDFVRVYFSCRPDKDENGQCVSRTAFLDLDRKNLFSILRISGKPILELGDRGCFDEFGIYPSSVIRVEPDDIRIYYVGWQRGYSVPFDAAIGLAISQDNGVTFKRYGRGAILAQSPDEPYVISGAKIRQFNGKWYLFYLSGRDWIADQDGRMESVYKIRMATSDDGIDFKREGRNIISDVLEPEECQAGADVFYYNGKYHMYFSYHYALNFRNKERGYRIGYAYSDDLYNWTRDDSLAGITVSEEGWDSEMQHYPHVFEMDGDLYMLYNGNDFGRYGFGLAKLDKSEEGNIGNKKQEYQTPAVAYGCPSVVRERIKVPDLKTK
jgi:predicted GH43/DUF377 family glycosyl hydrolase